MREESLIESFDDTLDAETSARTRAEWKSLIVIYDLFYLCVLCYCLPYICV